MQRLWRWLKAHLVTLPIDKPKDKDVRGNAVGFRFWF